MAKPEQRETFCSIGSMISTRDKLCNLMLKSNVATSPMEYDVRTKIVKKIKKCF